MSRRRGGYEGPKESKPPTPEQMPRPLSERVREAFAYRPWARQGDMLKWADEIAALEAEVDDWKQRYETLETWYDNRAKGITALEALNDGWQREHYKLEAEVKQLRLLTGWCECDTLPPGGQPCRSCSARLLRVVLNEGGEG